MIGIINWQRSSVELITLTTVATGDKPW